MQAVDLNLGASPQVPIGRDGRLARPARHYPAGSRQAFWLPIRCSFLEVAASSTR